MRKKQVNIWIWIQHGRLLKAISCLEDGTVKIYDENDNLIMKRTGLNKFQIKQVEINFIRYGANQERKDFRIQKRFPDKDHKVRGYANGKFGKFKRMGRSYRE